MARHHASLRASACAAPREPVMRSRHGLLGTLLLGFVLVGPLWAEDPPVPPEVLAAEQALAEGRSAEAIPQLRALLAAAEETTGNEALAARLRRGLARALLREGETYAALEPLERLAHAGGAEDLALYVEGLLAHTRLTLEGGSAVPAQVTPYLEDARRALARIPVEQGPSLGVGWLAGEIAYLAGRLEEAVARWSEATALAPAQAPRWYRERHAHALYLLGRPGEAAPVYEALENLRGAASSWAAAKQGAKAMELYARLLAEAPADEPLLTEALAAARFTGAQERLDAILGGLASDEPDVRALWALARARLWLQRGAPREARSAVRASKGGVSGPMLARLCAEEATALLRDPAGGEDARREAAEALLEGWRALPGDEPLGGLMALLVEQDFRAAPRAWPDRAPLERSLALQRALTAALTDDPVMQANLGNIARLAGAHDEAVAALTRAVELSGGDAVTRNDLGLALLAAGKPAEAEAAFRQALADDPAALSAPQNLARLVSGRGAEGALEARALLLAAEAQAREAGSPSHVYRALALKAWRQGRRPTPGGSR